MRNTTRITATAIALLLALGVVAAGADEEGPIARVDNLRATVEATQVRVQGTGVFTAPTSVVGEDPAGDGVLPGSDLTAASITPLSHSTLRFELDVADLPPPMGGTPEALNYIWPLEVVRGSTVTTISLQAWRTATLADATCGTVFVCAPGEPGSFNARFSVNTCAIDETGQNRCSAEGLAGGFSDTGLHWIVPAASIGAQGGATLHATGAIAASVGGSGLYWYTNGNGGDTMFWNGYVFPAASVRIGLAPTSTADEDAVLTHTATIPASGNFNTVLPRPTESGDYKAVVEACFGPDGCTRTSVPFAIP
jgi:hypothetical protein